MPGKHINQKQVNLYMNVRKHGDSQVTAAAKAGFSERTARRVEKSPKKLAAKRNYRTRKDPFEGIFEELLVPLLTE